jgi:hypothetical protein
MNQIQIQKYENQSTRQRAYCSGYSTLTNATQQIPGPDGNGNVPAERIMTNLGIPLSGSLAIGFTIGFMRG